MFPKIFSRCPALLILKIIAIASLFALTGCSSMPILIPDMAMQSSKVITLENSHGALSNQQSKK